MNFNRKGPSPMTAGQYQSYMRKQAEERRSRGLPTFTRPKRREEVLGSSDAENVLQRYHRQSQITRPRTR